MSKKMDLELNDIQKQITKFENDENYDGFKYEYIGRNKGLEYFRSRKQKITKLQKFLKDEIKFNLEILSIYNEYIKYLVQIQNS